MKKIRQVILKKNWPLFILLLTDIILYLVSFYFVADYYNFGLPYYDSVGSYWNMFSVMNTVQKEGILQAILHASQYPQSWIQSFFALPAAYILPKKPEYLIILNFVCLAVAQAAIFSCLSKLKVSKMKSAFCSLLLLLPQSMYNWEGGFVDLRRDASFLSLLAADYFLLTAYLFKPDIKLGIILGLVAGFTQWSRGNALPYIIIINSSVVIAFLIFNHSKEKLLHLLKNSIFPLLAYLLITLPFYVIHAAGVVDRYLNGSWAIGLGLRESFYAFFVHLYSLWLGQQFYIQFINLAFFLAIFIICLILYAKKFITLDILPALRDSRFIFLFSGILIFLLMFIFHVLIIRVGKIAGIFPSFPVLIGFYAIFVFLFCIPKFNPAKNNSRIALFLAFSASIILLGFFRILLTKPSPGTISPRKVKQIALDLMPVLENKQVAFLWLDHIHVHDLNFFMTQAGGKPIKAGSRLMSGADTEMPPDPGRPIKEQQDNFASGIRKREFIVVSKDPKAYADPDGFFFMLKYGEPVIEGLLIDRNYKVISEFSNGKYPFVVLQKNNENQF